MSLSNPASALARRHHLEGVTLLAVVAVLWGTTFVVIKGTVSSLDPSVIVLARFAIAALVFLPFFKRDRALLVAGLELGFWLWAGYASQAEGLQFTTASRSAFITAINVVLVPVFVGVLGRRVGIVAWISALVAFAGVGLLSFDGGSPNRGDVLTLVTAVTYAVYVLRLEVHARRFRARTIAAAQVAGVLPFALAWVAFDGAQAGLRLPLDEPSAWMSVLYLGLIATALTTWLQTVGQQRVSAPEAAVIYSSEPMWAAAFAAFAFGERLGPRGWIGAAVIVLAVVVSQVPWRRGGARQRLDANDSADDSDRSAA